MRAWIAQRFMQYICTLNYYHEKTRYYLNGFFCFRDDFV